MNSRPSLPCFGSLEALVLILSLSCAACTGDSRPRPGGGDTGRVDTGRSDAGFAVDGGPAEIDAGFAATRVRDRCDRLWTTACERFLECETIGGDIDLPSCVATSVDLCCSGSYCTSPDFLDPEAVDLCDADMMTRPCELIRLGFRDRDPNRVFPSSCDSGGFLYE